MLIHQQLAQITKEQSCNGWICTSCPLYTECWEMDQDVEVDGTIPKNHPILKVAKEKLERLSSIWLDDLMNSQN